MGLRSGCARCADTGRAAGSGIGLIPGFRADSGRRARYVTTDRATKSMNKGGTGETGAS